GRWDEWLALSRDAEKRAVATEDFYNAGWRAYVGGMLHFLRGQSTEVLTSADRAEAHWRESEAGPHEKAAAIRLRGQAYTLAKDYSPAVVAFREAAELDRSLGRETEDVADALNDLAIVKRLTGDLDGAEHDYR